MTLQPNSVLNLSVLSCNYYLVAAGYQCAGKGVGNPVIAQVWLKF
jgi:hypothetical protein